MGGPAAQIKRETGCKVLLATKAFALPAAFPLMRDVLDGTTASGAKPCARAVAIAVSAMVEAF